MFKHIFLTGDNAHLKSKIIDQLLEDKAFSGFTLLPYQINGQEKGRYLHSYVAVEDYDNDLPIEVKINAWQSVTVPNVLDYFGAKILLNSLHSSASIIKMDPLFISDHKALIFLEEFDRCLYSDKHIIGSLSTMNDELSALVFANKESCLLEINEANQTQIVENLKRIMSDWD